MIRSVSAIIIATGSLAAGAAMAQETNVSHPMGFFVTSVGLGDGGNLGGWLWRRPAMPPRLPLEVARHDHANTFGVGVRLRLAANGHPHAPHAWAGL